MRNSDSEIIQNVSHEPIFLTATADYPGTVVPIEVGVNECIRVKSHIHRVVYRHMDDIKYTIYFWELLDGTGWIHDFNYEDPSRRTILQVCGFPIKDIKHAAETYGMKEIGHNPRNRVICFKSKTTTYYVYYTTGTIAISAPHPRMGETLFFHHNQTIRDLCDYFASPRSATACVEEGHVVPTNVSPIRRRKSSVKPPKRVSEMTTDEDLQDESMLIREQIAAIDEENKVLLAEKDRLMHMLCSLEELDEKEWSRRRALKRVQEAQKAERAQQHIAEAIHAKKIRAAKQLAQLRVDRGELILCHSSHLTFLQNRWSVDVSCIAMGELSMLLVYDDGSWAAINTLTMSPLLREELHLTEYDDLHNPVSAYPLINYCAIGTFERCFVKFSNGSCIWHASNEFSECVKACDSQVKAVEFGEGYESYFMLFEDKSYCWNNLPSELERLIDVASPLDVHTVSLGSGGSWFLRQTNGTCHWGNLTKRCLSTMARVRGKMVTVHLGFEDSAFLVRYV